jgi:hypothetical protein
MAGGGQGSLNESRSVGDCLDDLHHNIEGMIKVPRMPTAVRIMLLLARDQIEELRAAVERELPSGPSEASFTQVDEHLR